MQPEGKRLSAVLGFGSVTRDDRGNYSVQIPGITVHLSKKGFEALVQLVLVAYDTGASEKKSPGFRVVKS